jgi:hypothetical protein
MLPHGFELSPGNGLADACCLATIATPVRLVTEISKLELRSVATEAPVHPVSSSAGMLTRPSTLTTASGLIPTLAPLCMLGFGLIIVCIVGVTAGLGGVIRDFGVSRDLQLPVVGIEARPASCANDNSRVANVKQRILSVLVDC